MGLLHDLDDGKKREITGEDFDYFLDVLAAVAMGFRWNGERWSFGFAEGYDYVYAFKKEGGQAFYRGDLCFIQQVNGGDEWLTIKQDTPFESNSFGRIIRDKGRQAAQEVIDRIRAAPVEKCKALEY